MRRNPSKMIKLFTNQMQLSMASGYEYVIFVEL